MDEFLRSMTLPFLACVLLAGIHVYLGIHVISRKVIFVDLALAQIAAFGAVYGVLLGYDLHDDPWAIKGFSLIFAFLGATVFSLTRSRRERIPQEAVIGITYAVVLAGTILASSHLPHGAEDLRELLSGSILWVRLETIVFTAILYAAIGVVLAVFHRKFLRISLEPERAHDEGLRIRFWDFLFYALFGFVVTSSVAISGVLLVFTFLVIPAVVAVLFADRIVNRLLIGWAVGAVVSFIGVVVSYTEDLPSGPTIVVAFGVFLVLAAMLRMLVSAPRKSVAVVRIAVGTVALLLFVQGTLLLRHEEERGPLDLLRSPVKNERLLALRAVPAEQWGKVRPLLPRLLADAEPEVRSAAVDAIGQNDDGGDPAVLSALNALLGDADEHVRETALQYLRNRRDPSSIEPLMQALEGEEDEYLQVEMAHALLEVGDLRGVGFLLDLMDRGSVPQVRKDAYEGLCSHLPVELPFRSDLAVGDNDEQVARIRSWLTEIRGRLRFDPATLRFSLPE